jgi:hypothetical protein
MTLCDIYRYYMHRGLPCSMKKVRNPWRFMMLSPKLHCNDLLLLQKASCEYGPTCDGMCVLFN